MMGCYRANIKTVQLMLKHGANVHLEMKVLYLAIIVGYEKMDHSVFIGIA